MANGQRRGGLIHLVPKRDTQLQIIPDAYPSIERVDGGEVSRLERVIASSFAAHLRTHPCIGARSVIGAGNAYVSVYPDMFTVSTAVAVLKDLDRYCQLTDDGDSIRKTLALVFIYCPETEQSFGWAYWDFAQTLHDLDCQRFGYPENISPNPEDATFEFCLRGRAIFTTTLHSAQTRVARHWSWPTWVLNQTTQFNALRDSGKMAEWQKTIRTLDAALDPSGLPNPILTDHGQASAAPQLPGIEISPCPFKPRITENDKRIALQRVLERARTEDADAETLAAIMDLQR